MERGGVPLILSNLGAAARERGLTLLTATEGNWGRAVARMARYMGLPAQIFVPDPVPEATRDKIRAEGGDVHVVQGGYDDCAAAVRSHAAADPLHMVMVMDIAWEGYEQVPQVRECADPPAAVLHAAQLDG